MISTRPEKKKRYSSRPQGLKLLFFGAAGLILILLAFGLYSMLRLPVMRLSSDYYFPFLKAVQWTEDRIADQTLLAQSKTTLAKALRNLMTENSMLSAERAVVSDLKKENAELRSLLKLGAKGTFRPVFAEVLARKPMTWQERFTIDKGSRDGLEPGNLVTASVFSETGRAPSIAVIGRIKSVTGHTADVSTILSQDFRISVSIPAARSSGILEGARRISDMCATLKFLPLEAVPSPGQLVCTNAFSGNSPPGLPVGRIVSRSSGVRDSRRNLLYHEIGVRPFESPAEVRFVAVFVKDKR